MHIKINSIKEQRLSMTCIVRYHALAIKKCFATFLVFVLTNVLLFGQDFSVNYSLNVVNISGVTLVVA
jgi:hypothetical protein